MGVYQNASNYEYLLTVKSVDVDYLPVTKLKNNIGFQNFFVSFK